MPPCLKRMTMVQVAKAHLLGVIEAGVNIAFGKVHDEVYEIAVFD